MSDRTIASDADMLDWLQVHLEDGRKDSWYHSAVWAIEAVRDYGGDIREILQKCIDEPPGPAPKREPNCPHCGSLGPPVTGEKLEKERSK